MKKKLLSMCLAAVMIFAFAIPALAINQPVMPSGGATLWVDDVRVEADQPATFTFVATVDDSYNRLNSVGCMFDIPAATTGISATTPMVVGAGDGATVACGSAAKKTGKGRFGFGAGEEKSASVGFTLPKVTATTAIGITLDPGTYFAYTDDNPDTAIPDNKVESAFGSVIVQYPVTVTIEGTVPAGAKVEAKTTEYADSGKNTYDSEGTTGTVATGDKIWVDSGSGQQNTPILDITAPTGFVAQYKVGSNNYANAGAHQTLGAITKETAVSVKFVQQAGTPHTVTYDANGGQNPPSPDTVNIPAGQTSVVANLSTATDSMTYTGYAFIGWSATKIAPLAADANDPTVISTITVDGDKTVFAVWGVDKNGNGVWDKNDDNSYTLTFDPNGGDSTPPAVTKNESDPDYTIQEVTTKGNAKFVGWFNDSDQQVTTWDTNSDLVVKAKFRSTYKFDVTAPYALKTNESYTEASVKLAADVVNDLGYNQAKLKVEMTAKPDGSSPIVQTLLGNLGNGLEYVLPIPLTKDFQFPIDITQLKADKPGIYTMEFSLLDSKNNDELICKGTHTIVVSDDNVNIVVAAPNITGTKGEALTGSFAASQTGGTAGGTYSASGLPAGLSINASTGAITGTPTVSGPGSYSVIYTDTENNSGTASGSYNIADVVVPGDYTLSYDMNGAESEPIVDAQTYAAGDTVRISSTIPTKTGYVFLGWEPSDANVNGPLKANTTFSMPKTDMTLTAIWDSEYDVTYNMNGADSETIIDEKNYNKGDTVKVSGVTPTKNGFVFGGWTPSDANIAGPLQPNQTFTMPKTVITLTAIWTEANSNIPKELNSTDHFAYVKGYPDSTVQPNARITRAEVSTMFYRLLKTERRDEVFTTTNNLSDVSADLWYNKAVSSMAKGNYIMGYPEGNFLGNNYITRAEFAAIASRFVTLTSYSFDFPDVPADHWAYANIATAAHYGWVLGYPDGTFRPEAEITRAEAMTIINRMLDRGVKAEGLIQGVKEWSDNVVGQWYYYEIIEASNDHAYTGSRPDEIWNSLTINYTYDQAHYETPGVN